MAARRNRLWSELDDLTIADIYDELTLLRYEQIDYHRAAIASSKNPQRTRMEYLKDEDPLKRYAGELERIAATTRKG